MINIRKGLFETNSSSVHSLVLCDRTDFDAWKEGRKYFIEDAKKFIYKEELYTYLRENFNKEELSDEELKKWYDEELDCYCWNELPISYLEYSHLTEDYHWMQEEMKSSSDGHEVVAFGYYGYDG